jgi:hypothetical protein
MEIMKLYFKPIYRNQHISMCGIQFLPQHQFWASLVETARFSSASSLFPTYGQIIKTNWIKNNIPKQMGSSRDHED